MKYTDISVWEERFELAFERLAQIPSERVLPDKLSEYFGATAQLLIALVHGEHGVNVGDCKNAGDDYDRLLSFLHSEISCLNRAGVSRWEQVVRMELFLEVYAAFVYEWQENRILLPCESFRRILYWFAFDYADMAAEQYVEDLMAGEMSAGESVLYDNQKDMDLLWDKGYVSRKLEALKNAFEKERDRIRNCSLEWDESMIVKSGNSAMWKEYYSLVEKIHQEYLCVNE